jgi:hypothetical protein
MSIAYKCDRCGKFYDENSKNHAGEPRIFTTCSISSSKYDHRADLCEECYESFMEWWNKPTVKRFHISEDSPYICTVTGDDYICMGGCGYKSGTQCMDDCEDSPCQYRTLPPDSEEPGADPPETIDCIKQGR